MITSISEKLTVDLVRLFNEFQNPDETKVILYLQSVPYVLLDSLFVIDNGKLTNVGKIRLLYLLSNLNCDSMTCQDFISLEQLRVSTLSGEEYETAVKNLNEVERYDHLLVRTLRILLDMLKNEWL